LPYPDDLRLRFILCLAGGIWALSLSLALWPLHAFTAVLQATGRCYERLAELIEAACSATPAAKERFPVTYETVLAAIGSARQSWTAVRVRRAGPSARSIQLLTLIENAAHLSHTAVALHEQMVLISSHPRFQLVRKEFERASVALGQLTRSIAGAIYRRGGQVDVRDLDNAQRSLEQAFEELRSSHFQRVEDYAVLPHAGKLLRGVKLIADNLRMDAGVAEIT
jgi:FUSC-like inner membrane protein yccS